MKKNKTYTINNVTLTNADAVPSRFARYCTILQIDNFDDLKQNDALLKLNATALNIFKDAEKVRELISVCVNEDVSEIDFSNSLTASLYNEIVDDFFSQLLSK